ncbi:hypothetical protein [Pararobbsia silviterrae]|uniref:Uncharacterized protein n=1 Tax=Pararobbsia silviterrae TaxID=1792498 RepID=A0A494XZ68_9BURK|nr:hypothetical protein [Pararobbsia silviterrae]RKP53434.1 hypothetical protein D7S86_17165 [Pararobbsia silviterrae]
MRFRFWMVGKFVLVIVCIAVLAAVVRGLWNWVMPTLFTGAQTIDYLHAIGLLVLSRVLLGGFHGHARGGCGPRFWRRWERMTPEEREQLTQGMAAMRGRRGWRC